MSDESGSIPTLEPAQVTPPASAPETRRSGLGWVGGLILIVLGIVFMLQSAGIMVGNWWTVFIFIPALVNFYAMFRVWRRERRFTAAATGSLIGGLLLMTVATILLLDLDWSKAWPAILISIGVGLVAGSLLGRK